MSKLFCTCGTLISQGDPISERGMTEKITTLQHGCETCRQQVARWDEHVFSDLEVYMLCVTCRKPMVAGRCGWCGSIYDVKPGYYHRTAVHYSDERPHKDQYQNEVYEYASHLPGTYVMDVGTGSGYKLLKYFKDRETLGTDIEPTLSFLRETYPDRAWLPGQFESPMPGWDILIAADIIEHMENPYVLLSWIKRCAPKHIILSTPDRDRLQAQFWNGPPKNGCHYREWNQTEFRNLVGRFFDIVEHPKVLAGSSTQYIHAKVKDA